MKKTIDVIINNLVNDVDSLGEMTHEGQKDYSSQVHELLRNDALMNEMNRIMQIGIDRLVNGDVSEVEYAYSRGMVMGIKALGSRLNKLSQQGILKSKPVKK